MPYRSQATSEVHRIIDFLNDDLESFIFQSILMMVPMTFSHSRLQCLLSEANKQNGPFRKANNVSLDVILDFLQDYISYSCVVILYFASIDTPF